MVIRQVQPEDARRLLQLKQQLDHETQFMLYEPGERNMNVEKQRNQIERLLARDNHMLFVAEQDRQLIGYIEATGGYARRNRHSVEIVIGILQTYSGQGTGTQLFQVMEHWARQQHLHRLELTVMAHNSAALALYTRQGFTIDGTQKHSLLIDGRYVDEYSMSKLLE